jgi:hypothetical protein
MAKKPVPAKSSEPASGTMKDMKEDMKEASKGKGMKSGGKKSGRC